MTRSNRRPLVAGALAACAALATGLLSACGSGQIAQTAEIAPAVAGVDAQASDRPVFVRNAMVDYREPKGYPAGASAPLALWIFNSSRQAVRLVGVTAAQQVGEQNAAAQVVLSTGRAAASGAPCLTPRSIEPSAPRSPTSPSPTPVLPAGSASSGTARSSAGASAGTSSASAGASATATASPSPSPAGASRIDVTVPAGGCVELSRRAAQYLQVVNLPQPLGNAGTLLVMFQFTTADGQNFTIGNPPSNTGPLPLAVGVPDSPVARPSVTAAG